MITQETIDSIQTVFRDHQGGGLWGLPYKMRHEIGQTPRHLWEGKRSPDPAHQLPHPPVGEGDLGVVAVDIAIAERVAFVGDVGLVGN